MTKKSLTISEITRSEAMMTKTLRSLLSEDEFRIVKDLFDRVQRHLTGSMGPCFNFSNEQRLRLLQSAAEKIECDQLNNPKTYQGIATDYQLFKILVGVAQEHLSSLDPNELLIIRCQACQTLFSVSRADVFEELGGHWYYGDPPDHDFDQELCTEGMVMMSEPDWDWNRAPLPTPTELDVLLKEIYVSKE